MSTSKVKSYSFPQISKVHDTLWEMGVTPELLQNKMLGEGVLADFAEAVAADSVPRRDKLRDFLGLRPRFEEDRYGRKVITVTGRGLRVKEWQQWCNNEGYFLDGWAYDILKKPDYETRHCLVSGVEQKVVLVRAHSTGLQGETIQEIMARAQEDYGKPAAPGIKGELAFLLREALSATMMEGIRLELVLIPHEPIIDSEGDSQVLAVDSFELGPRHIIARIDGEGCTWGKGVAVAYPVRKVVR